jgi:hypothetical protein
MSLLKNSTHLLPPYPDSSERKVEQTRSSPPASPKAKMIGESDRYDAERVAWWDSQDVKGMIRSDLPRLPALGSSSIPFEGGMRRLLEFIDGSFQRWSDETWDGLHVAENAPSDGEAEIHRTNGRVRLVVVTEATKEGCVALLMKPPISEQSIGTCVSTDSTPWLLATLA